MVAMGEGGRCMAPLLPPSGYNHVVWAFLGATGDLEGSQGNSRGISGHVRGFR